MWKGPNHVYFYLGLTDQGKITQYVTNRGRRRAKHKKRRHHERRRRTENSETEMTRLPLGSTRSPSRRSRRRVRTQRNKRPFPTLSSVRGVTRNRRCNQRSCCVRRGAIAYWCQFQEMTIADNSNQEKRFSPGMALFSNDH